MSARDRRGGFTLLETVVATTIIGLVAVSTLAALSGELRTAGKSQAVVEATALAEEHVVLVRLLTPDELDPLADSLKQGRFSAPFEAYEWRVTVDEVRKLGAGSLEPGTLIDNRDRFVGQSDAVVSAAARRRALSGWLAGARIVTNRSYGQFKGLDGSYQDWPDDVLTFATSADTPLRAGGVSLMRLYVERGGGGS